MQALLLLSMLVESNVPIKSVPNPVFQHKLCFKAIFQADISIVYDAYGH